MKERILPYLIAQNEKTIAVRHEVGLNVGDGYLVQLGRAILEGLDLLLNGDSIDLTKLPQSTLVSICENLLNTAGDTEITAAQLVDGGALAGEAGTVADALENLMLTNYGGIRERLEEKERQLYIDSDFEGTLDVLKKGTRIPTDRDVTDYIELDDDFYALSLSGDTIDWEDNLVMNVVDIVYVSKTYMKEDETKDTDQDADEHYGNSDWTLVDEDRDKARYEREIRRDVLLVSGTSDIICYSRIGKRLMTTDTGSRITPHPDWENVPRGTDRVMAPDARADSAGGAFFLYAYWTSDPPPQYDIPVSDQDFEWFPETGPIYRYYNRIFWPDIEDFYVSSLGGTWVYGKITAKERYTVWKRQVTEEPIPHEPPEDSGGGIVPVSIAAALLFGDLFGLKIHQKNKGGF